MLILFPTEVSGNWVGPLQGSSEDSCDVERQQAWVTTYFPMEIIVQVHLMHNTVQIQAPVIAFNNWYF